MDIIKALPGNDRPLKPLVWMGSSKKDLLNLPASVIDVFGYALYLAQTGFRHPDAKVLQGFGVNVTTFFTGMADQAKAWGERLMVTYGSGLMAGVVRVISKVVTTVANWIARFFEAHCPPEEGPLSTLISGAAP